MTTISSTEYNDDHGGIYSASKPPDVVMTGHDTTKSCTKVQYEDGECMRQVASQQWLSCPLQHT